MAQDEEAVVNERSHLLDPRLLELSRRGAPEEATSIISSHLTKDEQALGGTAIGER